MGEHRAANPIETLFRLGAVGAMSDGELLDRFAAGPDDDGRLAFEAIVGRHGSMVLGVCRRVLGDESAAEDAFQATFMVLAMKAPAIRSRESLGPWLHGVALRVARRASLAARRRRTLPMPDDVPANDPGVPEVERAEIDATIDEELRRLPEKYRLPLVLCYLEGRTQEQAARELGWSKGTVSGRLARARDLLRHRLARRGLAPTVGAVGAFLSPGEASAAVSAGLLSATVRAAVAAVLGGAEAGLVAGSVTSMAAAALRWMAVARVVRATAALVMLGGAAAVGGTLLVAVGSGGRSGPVAEVGRAPEVARGPRVDRYGDPLPFGADVRLGTIRRRHTDRVVGLGFTPNGRLISVQADTLARVWDGRSGLAIHADRLDDAPAAGRSIGLAVLSPDGRLLAAAGFDRDDPEPNGVRPLWIWEVEPHRLLRRIDVDTFAIHSLAFAPDGASIAVGGFRGDLQIRDVATGALRARQHLGNFDVHSLGFAPDGRSVVATAQAQPLFGWDLETGRVSTIGALRCSASSPRFSPDGRLLAVPEFGRGVAVWDCLEGGERYRVGGTEAVFAPDGLSLAVIGDGLSLVDTATGHLRWRSSMAGGMMATPPVFSPDGRTIVREVDGVLHEFDAGTGIERFVEDYPGQGKVAAIVYSVDGRRVLAADAGGKLLVWDARSAQRLGAIELGGRIPVLALSPDGRILAAASLGTPEGISVRDLESGRILAARPAREPFEQVRALGFSGDGREVLAFTGKLRLDRFEAATGRDRPSVPLRFQIKTGASPFGPMIEAAAFAPGGRFLAIREGRVVRVADLATGDERIVAPGRELAFAPDGRTLAIAAPSPDLVEEREGRKIVRSSLDSDAIRLVDLDSGAGRRFAIPREIVRGLAFSPDGGLLAVAVGQRRASIRIHRAVDGRHLQTIPLPAAVSDLAGLAFAPDGRSLAAGLEDTTIPIWDVGHLR